MRNLIVTEYMSLDGVMEEPGTWSFPFWNDEAAVFKYEELFASDALLLGRVTYEGFASAWPTMTGTGDFGERMNGIAKYVVSSTLDEATWNNSQIIKGNIAEAVAALKQQPGQDILIAGSAQLVHLLMQHDLVDEYRIMLHPIVLGSGKRLFREGSDTRTLKLADTKTTSTGVTILTYYRQQRKRQNNGESSIDCIRDDSELTCRSANIFKCGHHPCYARGRYRNSQQGR